MPRFDGTGPMGQGPMTGGGRGRCTGGAGFGYGAGYGRGCGWGRGAGFCRRVGFGGRMPLSDRKAMLEEELKEVEHLMAEEQE